MSPTTVPLAHRASDSASHDFSTLERMMLRRVHPVSIICDIVAVMWTVYFIWEHNWIAALASAIVGRAVAIAATWRLDFNEMAATVWGKIALLHLNPQNLLLQVAGGLIWIWGMWQHSTQIILSGLSLLAVGHIFGWSKVHKSLKLGQQNA